MENNTYDVCVIGSGPGGYIAVLHARRLKLKVICIEKDKTFGGTCLNVGCIPSKALLQATEHYSFLKNSAASFGITAHSYEMNYATLMDRKEKIVQGLTKGISSLFKQSGVDYLEGVASFMTPHEIKVGDKIIKASNFIIATGSKPVSLPFLPFDETTIVSSTGALSLSQIPSSMIVIGGGVIGVELASVYARLGTKVQIVEMLDSICTTMEREVQKALLKSLEAQDLKFHLGEKVLSHKKEGNVHILEVEKNGEKKNLEADVILVAVGRLPFTDNLNLSQIGIELNKGLIKVDPFFRTKHSHIYAIGDVIDGPMLAHKASEEGVAVAEIIAGNSPHINYLSIPNVIYTQPEAASVGMTSTEAKHLNTLSGIAYFRSNPRARCEEHLDGFIKVIALKETHHLIGIHMIGPHVSEIINQAAIAIEKKSTLEDIAFTPFAHPTLSETFKEACLNAL